MKIEILFPTFANLFGEKAAIRYLAQCLPEAEFIETNLNDTPAFAKGDVDMIYIGTMTEGQQELAIRMLLPYKEKIEETIAKGTVFLAVGNSLELFCDRIEDGDRVIPALGIFSQYAKRNMNTRYNSLVMGEMEGMKIIGFKSQFSQLYGDNSNEYMFKVTRGYGINPDSMYEGLRRNNFMATYTLGPLLILNPDLIKYIFKLLGCPEAELKYEDCIRKCYDLRLSEFEDMSRPFN
ncbi:MAG: hypothetical protein IJO77_04870 [Oscillospiraceae bacterium]|nr:hypothetical protein [Oscillospiraceae bacterium]